MHEVASFRGNAAFGRSRWQSGSGAYGRYSSPHELLTSVSPGDEGNQSADKVSVAGIQRVPSRLPDRSRGVLLRRPEFSERDRGPDENCLGGGYRHRGVPSPSLPLCCCDLRGALRAIKARGGDRQKKLFQFLNDIGARALRMQLGRVLEMAESSPDKSTYERKIAERFGGQQELELIAPNPSNVLPPPGEQSQTAVS